MLLVQVRTVSFKVIREHGNVDISDSKSNPVGMQAVGTCRLIEYSETNVCLKKMKERKKTDYEGRESAITNWMRAIHITTFTHFFISLHDHTGTTDLSSPPRSQ
jgi:hypothetical protein